MAEKTKKSPLVSFLSGGLAGAAEISVTMPLDTIKTQMQLEKGGNVVGTTRAILAKRGPTGLYYGMSAMLSQVSLKAAIRFVSFEQCKAALRVSFPDMASTQVNFLGGLGAGVTEAAVWVTPTERLKVLRQKEIHAATPKYTSLVGAFRTILIEQGPQGLFVGFVPTAARNGLAMAIRFMLYDEVKKTICAEKKATPVQSLVAGMVTGTVSSVINQPIDTAKSRIQAQDKGGTARYNGTVNCLVSMLKEEGAMSWYRGCLPRVLRLTIGQGIIFSSQEHISNALAGILV